MIKWNKKICIEHITQLKSPFEEQQFGRNGQNPKLRQIADRLRATITQLPTVRQ